MNLLEWDEKFSVGVNLIDGQHKKLFEMANEYYNAFNRGFSENAIERLLDGLLNYVAVHFGTEERYFAEYGYEDTKAHKREHQIIVLKVKDLVNKWQKRENPAEEEVSKFLKIWLEQHIMDTDHKYMECFHKHGLR